MRKILLGFFICLRACSYAEEGMWPFNMLPVEKIEKGYGVRLSDEWREHVQIS